MIPEGLYREIRGTFPIPCVDLVVVGPDGRVLLVRRTNEPAKGEWWFPGGRVHFGEPRMVTAVRKLAEECALEPEAIVEAGTHDLFLNLPEAPYASHAITTVYHIAVREARVRLDSQASVADWRSPQQWLDESLPEFVRTELLRSAADLPRVKAARV